MIVVIVLVSKCKNPLLEFQKLMKQVEKHLRETHDQQGTKVGWGRHLWRRLNSTQFLRNTEAGADWSQAQLLTLVDLKVQSLLETTEMEADGRFPSSGNARNGFLLRRSTHFPDFSDRHFCDIIF